jgi:alpha-D-ribose 1-methylphosphonate 5-triphosphate synthase subunit PhnH
MNLAATLAPGFADPIDGSRAVFRAAMAALAEPGSVRPVVGLAAPAPLAAVAAALALTLADYETPLWRDAALATPAIDGWLTFHAGAPLTETLETAAFALFSDADRLAEVWDRPSRGSDLEPETATTVILAVAGLGDDAGPGGDTLRLSGPGIETTRDLVVTGLPADFVERRRDEPAFPRGLDVFLAGPRGIVGLPRTTRIERI